MKASLVVPAGGLRPFYMWAGGKTRLLKHYGQVWPDMSQPHHYVEPFFGGGAVFGALKTQQPKLAATIGDINTELTGVLQAVKTAPEQFLNQVMSLGRELLNIPDKPGRKDWYYQLRQTYWSDPTPATLYVLMRTGFNGIWQTCKASQGLFGTPAGLLNQQNIEQIVDVQLISDWSAALQNTVIHDGSYETVPLPDSPALIFLDPPYRHSFTNYSTGFNDDHQERLTDWFVEQTLAGHKVLLANRHQPGDPFFEKRLGHVADIHLFEVTYTAGRRKRVGNSFEAKPAVELLAISKPL
ncbi:MAG: Dam family site-specific DNA-(adenine-N6)-methyltransferase [Acidimicrobiia bacterium]